MTFQKLEAHSCIKCGTSTQQKTKMGGCLSKDATGEKSSSAVQSSANRKANSPKQAKGQVSSSSSSNNVNNSKNNATNINSAEGQSGATNNNASSGAAAAAADISASNVQTNGNQNINGSATSGSHLNNAVSPGSSSPALANGITAGAGAGAVDTNDKEFKILLLGSGESGKSTILKQMKILHQNGYTREELIDYKPFVFRNVLDCAKSIAKCYTDFEYPISMDVPLVKGANSIVDKKDFDATNDQAIVVNNNDVNVLLEDPRTELTPEDIEQIIAFNVSSDPNDIFDPRIAKSIDLLWAANSTKNLLVEHKDDFYLMDSAKYFFRNLARIASPNYIPNVTDVLRTRKKTSGIFETRFNMGNSKIHMVDVGGQRSERKKWIHCFDNVTIIIFCVSLSEYDQSLLEEKSQNRLEESLVLFDSVVNSRWFSRTSIVLFLNKIDVFAEKLEHSPLQNYFPDYTGGNDITKAAKYILWRFKQVNRSNLTIYPHVTQATDTTNIKVVFAAVQETILSNSLKDSGIITIS